MTYNNLLHVSALGCNLQEAFQNKYEACKESKDTSRVGRWGNFYAYYGNTVVDFDFLPVSRARLTLVEPALFE